jgi:hypothetical protein
VLQELYARRGRDHRTTAIEELVVSLEEYVNAQPQAHIVLTALDEYPEREELLERLVDINEAMD